MDRPPDPRHSVGGHGRFEMRKSVLALAVLAVSGTAALADSCWMHNGSVMRLQASGDQRWFTYEAPRAGLYSAGVTPGTLLFSGTKSGNWYAGLSRVFSLACPGNPLEYWVEGPVTQNSTRVTMTGTRETSQNCVSTGQIVTDTLVFTYSHQC